MKKLLQQALDALDSLEQNYGNLWQFSKTPEELDSLLNTIRAELEKPEQEPVGWATVAQLKRGAFMEGATPPSYMNNLIPLYTKGNENV